jgi:hypothetical protein
VNYTPAEASVSLTVADVIPASVTWQNPQSISYGTAISAEQLNASSSVPGSFLYAPAAGEVLPVGKHKLSVIFTPKDERKYAQVQANAILTVEELPNIASLLKTTSLDRGVTAHPASAGAAEPGIARKDAPSAQDVQVETRLYKGAVYAKGNDGQWHLQRE